MSSLTFARNGGKVESKKFDDRTTFSLSEGVFKKVDDQDDILFISEKFEKRIPIDHKFFENRISKETQLLKDHPTNPKVYIRIGDVYFANNKFQKAKTFYNKAFSIDRNNPIYIRKLVTALLAMNKVENAERVLGLVDNINDAKLLHIFGVLKLAIGKLEEAESVLRQINKDEPHYYEVANSLGLTNLIKKDFPKAQKYFEESISANPEYPQAGNNLAVTFSAMGNKKKAIEQYKKVIAENLNYIDSYNNLFNLYVSDKRISDAYDLMVSAKHLIRADIEVQFRLGWCLMKMSKYEEAISEYQKVFEYLPNNSNTLNNIGVCNYNLNKIHEAEQYFYRASREKDTNILPFRNILVVYEQIGNVRGLKAYSQHILRMNPNDPYGLVYYGGYLVEEERWDEALETLSRAYQTKPPLITLYLSLSFLYSDIFPDFEKGMEVINHALEAGIDRDELILNNYLHLLLTHGKIAEAKKVKLKISDSTAPTALSTLALLELKLGNIEKAISTFDAAISKVAEKYKPRFEQRKYYDLAMHYIDKKEYAEARKYLYDATRYAKNGFRYIAEKVDNFSFELDEA